MLILLRHGQSERNLTNTWTGWFDSPITKLGITQAKQVKNQLQFVNFCSVYSSPLSRAYDTAKIISNQSIEIIEEFKERDYGDLTGLNKNEAIQKWGEQKVLDYRQGFYSQPPNGESLSEVADRVSELINTIYKLDGNKLVVSHKNTIRAMLIALKIVTPEIIHKIDLLPGNFIILD